PLRVRQGYKDVVIDIARRRTRGFWKQDLEAAKVEATRDKKDLLLYFGGSDWCPNDQCVREQYLSRSAVNQSLAQGLVVVEFDSPRYRPKPANHQLRNELARRLQITGVPSLVLADARGLPFAKLAGRDETWTPEKFIDQIVELRKMRAKRDELLANAAQFQGVERAHALDKALSVMPADFVGEYAEQVREIVELDAADNAGLRGKYLLQTSRYDLSDTDQANKADARVARTKWTLMNPLPSGEIRKHAADNNQKLLSTAVWADSGPVAFATAYADR